MANPEHFEILKQGVVVWIPWNKDNPDTKPNFYKADLSNLSLQKIVAVVPEQNLIRL